MASQSPLTFAYDIRANPFLESHVQCLEARAGTIGFNTFGYATNSTHHGLNISSMGYVMPTSIYWFPDHLMKP